MGVSGVRAWDPSAYALDPHTHGDPAEHGHVRAVTQCVRRRRHSACEWERGRGHEGEGTRGGRGGGVEREDASVKTRERVRARAKFAVQKLVSKDEVVLSGEYLPYKPSAGA